MIVFVPLELIYRILEGGYYTPSGTPNYQLLKACTLVCRTWSGPAQAPLFRSPPRIAARTITISKFYAALLSSVARRLRTNPVHISWAVQRALLSR